MKILEKIKTDFYPLLKKGVLLLLFLLLFVFVLQAVNYFVKPGDLFNLNKNISTQDTGFTPVARMSRNESLVAQSKISPAPIYSGTSGSDAENYEVTDYQANIETRKLDKDCSQILSLKDRKDVIFENESKHKNSCSYRFKVVQDSAPEILAIIKKMNPKELNKNTYTIKKIISNYKNEEEILNKKKQALEQTLAKALQSYDEISKIASQAKDTESLTKIIDSKIQIIDRTSQEQIRINEQLDRLERAKTEQLERLDYIYFNINIQENKYLDFEKIKDSWQTALHNFVQDFNNTLQNISINLLTLILKLLQYVLYLFILLIFIKYSWKWGKKFWQR